MKRDLDRIRDILFICEEDEKSRFSQSDPRFSDFDRHQIGLLSQAGYLEMHKPGYKTGSIPDNLGLASYGMHFFTITWTGHDYLDAIRNEGVWAKTKDIVAKEGGNMALELVKALAVGFAKKQLEDRTGFKL